MKIPIFQQEIRLNLQIVDFPASYVRLLEGRNFLELAAKSGKIHLFGDVSQTSLSNVLTSLVPGS